MRGIVYDQSIAVRNLGRANDEKDNREQYDRVASNWKRMHGLMPKRIERHGRRAEETGGRDPRFRDLDLSR